MTISYNWLCDYLPENIDPERLSKILTSIGLEVESLEAYESIRGGLKGLVIGEVLECTAHPNADKLKLTLVDTGGDKPLQIVCGAPNVGVGQKVVVAQPGTTIYPLKGEPVKMKVAKIRGIESYGMICAEDEIGTGSSHDGIIVLEPTAKTGLPAAGYFKPYLDWIFEIGLTPNRMDAMSHFGVAKDVCTYLTHHENREIKPRNIFGAMLKPDTNNLPVKVLIENDQACQRYSGISISGITIGLSPEWLKNRLQAIGQRSVNNIVDITNYILHETGQPLHAFDADQIEGKTIHVKNVPKDTLFTTLDQKVRKLDQEDLMICNEKEAMCIAGVFGGLTSGISESTKNIFLESAWFDPVSIRKTSVRHTLRTDAASRFEKGVDISNTVNVLKRAAQLIKEITGGEISSEIVDVYPNPREKKQVSLKYHYLKKLSGKNYHQDAVRRILNSLGFEMLKEGMDEMRVAVPFSKPDITLPADIVEEILRIDGLDNIEIPALISLTPATETLGLKERIREKMADYLTGLGFQEIMTNSITNSRYFGEKVLSTTVKMINNLSADLNILRPSMLETGLESIAYNINRKNTSLRFFEFGKTYHQQKVGEYSEEEHLCLYLTGNDHEDGWREKSKKQDFFVAKGISQTLLAAAGLGELNFKREGKISDPVFLDIFSGKDSIGVICETDKKKLEQFEIKQPVYFTDIRFEAVLQKLEKQKITYQEIPKFPMVQRDLAIIVGESENFQTIQAIIKNVRIPRLKEYRLFDVFRDPKLGKGKKSVALSFNFLDEEKTLTDGEIDAMMGQLITALETGLKADIRK